MVKENQRVLNVLNAVTDAFCVVLSIALAYVVRFWLFNGQINETIGYYCMAGVLIAPLFLFLYAMFGLYESFRAKPFRREFELIFNANVIGTGLLIAAFFIFKNVNISRWALVIFFVFCTAMTSVKRGVLRRILRGYRARGYNIKHVLVVGTGRAAEKYIRIVQSDSALGYRVAGRVADTKAETDIPLIGSIGKLDEILANGEYDEVIAALAPEEAHLVGMVINACEKNGVKLSLIPYYVDYMSSNPYIDQIGGLPVINTRRVPLDNIANAFLKRAMDVIGAAVLIVITSPIMLLAAVGTRLSSPGPVIFKQERVGKDKHLFTMYKFRSMRVNSRENSGWTTDADPRRTKFGAFIRKCSIDELPQFFNVLKGDMSLVGPRPELQKFVEQFREDIPLYMVKHQVRPGITGWAQVNGYRGDTSISERIRHDIYYIENWSVFFDIKILLMTAFGGMINSEELNGREEEKLEQK